MNKTLLLITVVLFASSCSEKNSEIVSDGYNEDFRLQDDVTQSLFIERLSTSGLDYMVSEDGAVRFHAKDREEFQQLAFGLPEEPYLGEIQIDTTWKVSEEEVKKIVLNKYPNILSAARMVGPMVANVSSGINGFAYPEEKVWHIRIVCKSGGTKALFFVHPDNGRLYEILSPDAVESSECE